MKEEPTDFSSQIPPTPLYERGARGDFSGPRVAGPPWKIIKKGVKMKRMVFLPVLLVLGAVLIGLVPGIAGAEEPYPPRPIQAIVPFPPGGVSDLVARPCALSK